MNPTSPTTPLSDAERLEALEAQAGMDGAAIAKAREIIDALQARIERGLALCNHPLRLATAIEAEMFALYEDEDRLYVRDMAITAAKFVGSELRTALTEKPISDSTTLEEKA